MGSKEIWSFICYVVLILIMLRCIKGQEEDLYESRNSLDSFIHKSAVNKTGRIITANVTSTDSRMVEIRTTGDPVLIRFPEVSVSGSGQVNVTDVKCVQFKSDGEVMEFSNVNVNVNVSVGYTCIARGHGHFGLVIPVLPISIPSKKSKSWKWWVIGFVVGICALGLLIGVGILVYKCFKKKKIGKMEKESERSVALESIWVGPSRMPKANGTRTQPIIEDSYAP